MPTSNRIGWSFASILGAAIVLSGFVQTNPQLHASTAIMQDEESDDQEKAESESSDEDDESNSEKKKEDDKPKKKKKPKRGPEGTNIGENIREISGKDVEGVKFSLADYEGKVVMLDFWGDW